MTDANAGAAAPVGTTHAPAAPAGGAAPNPAPAGGAAPPAPPAGGQQPPAGDQQPPAGQQPPPQGAEGGQQPPNPPPAAGEFKVPDVYKDKPWAAKVKSMDDVFKQLDNLDTLAGKKNIVPDLKTATPEQKEAFYAQLRPKDATAYVIPDDINGFPIAPQVKEGVGKMFLENGISEVQGNAVIKAYNEMGKQQVTEMFSPEGMETSLKQAFGDNWKGITGQVRNTIKGMMTPEDAAMLDKMPNAYLGVIYRTLGNTVQKFGVKETDAHVQAGGGNAGGGADMATTRAGLRADLARLAAQPHTADQANTIRQKLADTYKNDPRIQR